jgi:two-component system, LytTR family, sensor kinase
MIIGTEISYLIVSLIFNTPYHLSDHIGGYRFNFFIVILVGTLILLYRVQSVTMLAKIKEKEVDLIKSNQLKTQAELETLQSKINPHFLYNSLNSIASLIHEDADKAEDMTLNLSRLFRYSLNMDQENISSIQQEIEILETYLAIEKVRFGDRITFKINVEEELYSEKIPRFLIQPLVENALKHGLNNITENGLVQVEIKKENSAVVINIMDNGKNFPEELNMGYGLQSTYDKLQLLYGDSYQVQITNVPQKQIRIVIPLLKQQ